MRLTIERKDLAEALGLVRTVAARGDKIPILQNVLLRAGDGRLRLTATDTSIQLSAEAAAQIETPGAITVPAGLLNDLVRNFPAGGDIRLELDGARMRVKCGRSTYRLPTLPEADFPVMTVDGTASAEAPIVAWKRLLGRALPNASDEATRYYLNAVNLRRTADGAALRAEATDGRRMAHIDDAKIAGLDGTHAALSRESVGAMLRLLDASKGSVELRVGENRAAMIASAGELVARLQDGTFPDTDRLVPQEEPAHRVEGDVDVLAAALKRAVLVTEGKSGGVNLVFEPGAATIKARSQDIATEGEEIVAVDYDGAGVTVGFNARLLLPLLEQLEGGRFALRINDPLAPVVITAEADPHALYLLMPLRV